MNIPNELSGRAERIIGIINIIVHRYPFPQALYGGDSVHQSWAQRPAPIVFTDFEQLGPWLKDLGAVIDGLSFFSTIDQIFFKYNLDPLLSALAFREKKNIETANNNTVIQKNDELDPYIIINEFIKNMANIQNVYNTATIEFNRANDPRTKLISKPFLLVILFSGFIIFIVGIVLPLCSASLNPILYIHLPLAYYAIIYIIIIVKFLIY